MIKQFLNNLLKDKNNVLMSVDYSEFDRTVYELKQEFDRGFVLENFDEVQELIEYVEETINSDSEETHALNSSYVIVINNNFAYYEIVEIEDLLSMITQEVVDTKIGIITIPEHFNIFKELNYEKVVIQ